MNVSTYANRGVALEDLIKLANEQYRKKGIAVIHKIPSKWVPIRNKKGKIVSAKIDEKAGLDFMGRYKHMPIAFDAKSVTKGNRWYLKNLSKHQFNFLKDWHTDKTPGFLLLGFWETEEFFVIPFDFLSQRWDKWLIGGPASFKLEELREVFPVIRIQQHGVILDYLSVLDRQFQS
ncbi:MAG: Holliday junction resolvase RecU [Atribacterales bacterium]